MKKLWVLLACVSFSYGQSLESLLLKLKSQNLTLQQAQDAIMIEDENHNLAGTWENPTLGIGANDLLIDDITARDREPMQTHFVTFSQKIPLGGKVDLKRDVALREVEIAKSSYHDRGLRLASLLRGYAYKVAIIEKKLNLITRYQQNVKKLKRLHTKLFEVGKSPQSLIEDTKILAKRLLIKKRKLVTMKGIFLHKIEALVYEDVPSVEVALEMDKNLSINLQKHPIMIGETLKVEKSQEALKLAKASKIPDVKLGLGYFQREDRSDYLAINAGIELPIRGRENSKIQIASLKLAQAKKHRASRLFALEKEIEVLEASMQDAKNNFHTLMREIVPKKRYIGKLLAQELFTKNSSTTTLVSNLNARIVLELDAYDEMDSYFSAYAKLVYFEGGLS